MVTGVQTCALPILHNLPGPEWETWNERTRNHLISTQIIEGCAAGSWKPIGHSAGPVMSTSIHALTLEVYYRSAPIYSHEQKIELPKQKIELPRRSS